MHVSWMTKQVSRPPQQLDPSPLHLLFDLINNRIKILLRLRQRISFRRHINVMKCEIRNGQPLHKIKGHAHTVASVFYRVSSVVPWPLQRRSPKRISAVPAKRVPVNNTEPQMITHRLAFDHFVRIVVTKGQWVFGIRSLERNRFDIGKVIHWIALFIDVR